MTNSCSVDSDVDPVALDQHISREVGVANKWYKENGMTLNPEKHHAMIIWYHGPPFFISSRGLVSTPWDDFRQSIKF